MKIDKLKKTSVIVVDDHPIVREGISQLINQHNDFDVVAQFESAEIALEKIEEINPDFAIIDISLGGMSGLELIKRIKGLNLKTLILALSMHDENLYAERVMRAGANGYIMKKEPPEQIIHAVQKIIDNGIYFSERLGARLMKNLVLNADLDTSSEYQSLSDRELEVFKLIGIGKSTKEIASDLVLSVKTIETYKEHIKRKLSLKDAGELFQKAIYFIQNDM